MNRDLVERATHPEAKDAIAADLDWMRESELQTGLDFAHQGIAAGHRLETTEDFSQLAFPDAEEKVRTRLGDDRITFAFAPPAPSPFGGTIADLGVPAWMIGSLDALPEAPIAIEPTDGGFRFAIGGRPFVYDRFGLQKAASI